MLLFFVCMIVNESVVFLFIFINFSIYFFIYGNFTEMYLIYTFLHTFTHKKVKKIYNNIQKTKKS